jgi:hypothetical protein
MLSMSLPTDIANVQRLMDGSKADIAFTSPPYNVGKSFEEKKQKKASKYINDKDKLSDEQYLQLLLSSTKNALAFSSFAFINLQSLSNNKKTLIKYLSELSDIYAYTMIWDKGSSRPAKQANVLNSQFECIHIFSKQATRAVGVKTFRGTIPNVLKISANTHNEFAGVHNAAFSISFAEFFLKNFANESVIPL